MSTEKMPTVLHIIGSPLEVFDFNLSLYYATMHLKANYDKMNGYRYELAMLHPGGSWSFPADVEDKQSNRFQLIEAMKIIEGINPDVVLLHMFCTKTPSVIAMLELLQLPTIGAPSYAYSNVTDKGTSRGLMKSVDIPIPQGALVDESTDLETLKISYPCIVKPTKTENSIGLSMANNKDELYKGVDTALGFGPQVVVEKFIPGREIRVGVIEDSKGNIIPLPCLEYVIDHNNLRRFEDKLDYDGDVKLARTAVTKWVDEKAEKKLVKKLQDLAVRNHIAFQNRDFSLLDTRVTSEGEAYVLECNVFCSLSPSSVINRMVKRMGMTDAELVDIMVNNAIKRSCL